MALCALAAVGNVSISAKTVTDIPTHLLGDWDIIGANQWGREEQEMITLRKVPVHAWVQITREKIRVVGRDPNSETDFVDSEYEVTFSGSGTPYKINLQDLEGYWEVEGIFCGKWRVSFNLIMSLQQ